MSRRKPVPGIGPGGNRQASASAPGSGDRPVSAAAARVAAILGAPLPGSWEPGDGVVPQQSAEPVPGGGVPPDAGTDPAAGSVVGPSSGRPFPLRRIAVVVDEGVSPFEFAIPCEVFGVDRRDGGVPPFDFWVCAPRPGPVRTLTGFDIVAPHGLDELGEADLVVVPAMGIDYRPEPELVDALRGAVARGARVISLCSGAFVLGRAGLLDGRRATTHWRFTEEFRRCFPAAELVPDVLFVEDGPVATSAGTAAGIDLCLHLVRSCLGPSVATTIARRMVVPAQRDGGQAQFVARPVPEVGARTLTPLLDWVSGHLDLDLSVSVLAARVAMSERTFARRFREETGTTPHQWVLGRRVALAEDLLETTDLGVEEVARRCGFGSATMLRHHFGRLRRIAPTAYRRAFGQRPAQVG
ncbi:MAG TPA: helix-turn-helix domain-containing protein [Kineosporiaceae bacterium]|nr:helix-turn-helix domain-containing protein [Kineosporiaceae bacterium]